MKCLPTGPSPAKLMLIAEAPGQNEEREGKPLIGKAGEELNRMLVEAGIDRSICRIDNVFHDRPPDNKLHDSWCRGKKEVSEAYLEIRESLVDAWPDFDWPSKYTWNSLQQGKYLMPEHLGALPRLRDEILKTKPNLVVALGGTPLWALTGVGGIKKLRGTVMIASLVPGLKILPTWHPSYVGRVWSERLTCVVDLTKAGQECEFPDIRRPSRKIWINPTLPDLDTFYDLYIKGKPLLSFDTETSRKQITHISFATSKDVALVIPFLNKDKPGYNYWPTQEEEVAAWKFVRKVMTSDIPKLAQNGMYDLQYLWIAHGIPVKNYAEDTMLLHHALYLELPKDLGYLGSVYTNEASWKLMRTRGKDTVDKKDD